MVTETIKAKQDYGDILKGDRTTNLRVQYLWYGSSNALENENHTDLQTPFTGARRLTTDTTRINKDFVVSDFLSDAPTALGVAVNTVMNEAAIFWEPVGVGDMHSRTIADGLPLTLTSGLDIRVDFTITHDQG